MIRVLLVDDQAMVRTGFEMILSVEDDIEVVGGAANGQEALARCDELDPDVVLMDVQMPVLDGVAATRAIVAAHRARVLVLTTFDRDDYLFDALAAGASGFLLKNAEPERLVDAIRVVAGGQALLAPDVTMRVIERMTRADEPRAGEPTTPTPPTAPAASVAGALGNAGDPAGRRSPAPAAPSSPFTTRETEVLYLVAEGLSNQEIGEQLFVTEATVKTHVSAILAKLGLRDRVQAVVWAHRAGMTRG